MDWKTLTLVFFCSLITIGRALPPPCDSPIYCISSNTSLLHVVQMARLYKDSKTFVDKSIKTTPQQVLENFEQLMKDNGNNPTKDQVRAFVDANFNPEGSEFEDWVPDDWKDEIPLFNKIKDSKYKELAVDLHKRWKDLGRVVSQDVKQNPEKYSLHYLDQPFVVPGGRFREMYYWDSYWTIQGMIVSELFTSVRGMLDNFVQLIKKLGHIPNGNRIYYNRRTQPPLFISMVDAYYEATSDTKFIEDNIEYLDKEFNYWMANRTLQVTVHGKTHQMARYNVEVDDPRPESYYEDFNDAAKLQTPEEKQEFYQNMKSGAESGWDYSTRWFFKEDGTPSTELLDIKTRHIIPVDLNSYLCKNAQIMSKFYNLLGQQQKANEYQEKVESFKQAIDDVLWNNEKGAWFDYNTKVDKQNLQFYPSNIAPLWADCYTQTKLKEKVLPVLKYVEDHKAFDYIGGVPTSMVESHQQWDFSNAWPPLQEIIVTGLENTGEAKGLELAKELVEKWVRNVYVSYDQSNKKMFEKYDVLQVGLPGGGGEYDVQEGFGWSNGVIMHFLSKYGDNLVSTRTGLNNGISMQPSWIVSSLSLIFVTLSARFVYLL